MATQAIDFSDLGAKPVPIQGQGMDFSDLGGKPVQSGGQTMAAGSYQSRKGGPILNANDSAAHAGVSGFEQALGITKPLDQSQSFTDRMGDALGQIGSSLKQFGVKSWDELQNATGEKDSVPVAGTPLTDALYVPHVIARGIEGLASGIESGSSDIESGIQHKDVRSAAYGLGVLTGMKAQMKAGQQGGQAASDVLKSITDRLQAPLGQSVGEPRGNIPPEAYSPEDLKDYANQNGVNITAAQATENVGARNIQSAGERSTFGGSSVRSQTLQSQGQFLDHAQNLMDRFSPKTPDAETMGSALQDSIQQALDNEMTQSRQAYAAVDQAAQGVTVDTTPVKQIAQKILANQSTLRAMGLDPGKATRILGGIDEAPDNASFSEAQQIRSALLDAARSPDLAISNVAQGSLKQIIGSTDKAMMDAAQGQPGLESAFRSANDHWQQLQTDFNSPRSPLAQALSAPDPASALQKIIERGQTGGSTYKTGLLDDYGIDKGPIRRAILQDLTNKDFRLWNKTLGGYSNNFLQTIFEPADLDEVYKTGMLARSLGMNTNPSGTAAVMAAQNFNPLAMLPNKGAAAATTSQGFNQWLMNRTPPPAVKPGTLSLLFGTSAGRQGNQ